MNANATTTIEIEGKTIQHDRSGVGSAWRDATENDCPANVQTEIACEIIDGGQTECEDFTASNGQHYRW